MLDERLPDTHSRWLKVRDIYGVVLDEAPEKRLLLVQQLCGDDRELKAEVESLLGAHERVGSFMGKPALEVLAVPVPDPAAAELDIDMVLNRRFEVRRFLDRGGMGSVYEAWDRELGEMVALKTILPEIAADASIIQYFKDEVKQARRVSHPNVCRVYDLFCNEQPGGKQQWFLTMQMLEGTTLQRWLRERGPFSRQDALALVEQMVSGLSAAHELGVVHRDFKSGNIILIEGSGGTLKAVITDFGLAARMTAGQITPVSGKLQGSPAYVAPEQWFDGVVGPTGDQFSLGVVMCEMITGKRPLLSWLRTSPARVVALPADSRLRGRWERVIRRCLQVRPEQRFSSVNAIMRVLDPGRRRRAVVGWAMAGACVSLLTLLALLGKTALTRKPSIRDLRQLTPTMDLSTSPSLSRDGKTIAYASDRAGSGTSDIWVQHLPDGVPVRITEDAAGDEDPSLSPDGKSVVFVSSRAEGGVYIASAEGGATRLIVPGGKTPHFSPDGKSILYWYGEDSRIRATGRIFVMRLDDEKPIQLAVGFADARNAIWNSDGRHVLFKGCAPEHSSIPACWDWWVTTIDGQAPRATGALRLLASQGLTVSGEWGGWRGDRVMFSAAYANEEHLWEIEVAPDTAAVSGKPTELKQGDPRERIISSSLADGDTFALTDLSSAVHIWRIEPKDRSEGWKPTKVTQDTGLDVSPSISSNGRWLVFARGKFGDRPIWLRDLLLHRENVFPASGSDKYSPLIDDTGTNLIYESWEDYVPFVSMQKSGAITPEVLCRNCRAPTGWFDRDKGLFVSNSELSSVEMYRPATHKMQTILKEAGAFVAQATWSAANQAVLFTVSNGPGHEQAFVARFSRTAATPDGHWIPITPESESVQLPRWSEDGKTIYYLSNHDNFWCLWAQAFDAAKGLPSGEPTVLQHYHSSRFSPGAIGSHSLNLSVAGNTVYLNIAEMSGTIWTGTLKRSLLPSM